MVTSSATIRTRSSARVTATRSDTADPARAARCAAIVAAVVVDGP
jgi:hypothetical protein